MPNNKVHSRSKLQGKKGSSAIKNLHPHSRRASQFARVELREKTLQARQNLRARLTSNKSNALLWFALAVDPDRTTLSGDEVHRLVQEYLCRNDEAIEAERKARRKGRPISKLQEKLEEEKARETREYSTGGGLVIPDLTDEVALHNLRYWSDELEGNPGFLPKLKLIRIYKDHKELAIEQAGADARIGAVNNTEPVSEDEVMEPSS